MLFNPPISRRTTKNNFMYLGFPITFDISVPDNIYHGKSYPKLQQIKSQVDPLNILTSTGTIFY